MGVVPRVLLVRPSVATCGMVLTHKGPYEPDPSCFTAENGGPLPKTDRVTNRLVDFKHDTTGHVLLARSINGQHLLALQKAEVACSGQGFEQVLHADLSLNISVKVSPGGPAASYFMRTHENLETLLRLNPEVYTGVSQPAFWTTETTLDGVAKSRVLAQKALRLDSSGFWRRADPTKYYYALYGEWDHDSSHPICGWALPKPPRVERTACPSPGSVVAQHDDYLAERTELLWYASRVWQENTRCLDAVPLERRVRVFAIIDECVDQQGPRTKEENWLPLSALGQLAGWRRQDDLPTTLRSSGSGRVPPEAGAAAVDREAFVRYFETLHEQATALFANTTQP